MLHSILKSVFRKPDLSNPPDRYVMLEVRKNLQQPLVASTRGRPDPSTRGLLSNPAG